MKRQCETWQKHARARDGILLGPGEAQMNRKWFDGTHSGGSPAVIETNRPAATALDNSGSATPGFNDWFESSKQNADEMWRLQVEFGDPTFEQLSRARQDTEELRRRGGLHPRRRRRRPNWDED